MLIAYAILIFTWFLILKWNFEEKGKPSVSIEVGKIEYK